MTRARTDARRWAGAFFAALASTSCTSGGSGGPDGGADAPGGAVVDAPPDTRGGDASVPWDAGECCPMDAANAPAEAATEPPDASATDASVGGWSWVNPLPQGNTLHAI